MFCKGERRSRWLITNIAVAGRWSWQRVVVLVAQGRAGGRNNNCRRANGEEENVNGDVSRLLRLWRKRGRRMVERDKWGVEGGGGPGWLLGWRRERERQKDKESGRNREGADVLDYFGPHFLSLQSIKSTSIYRRWKRAILSILRKNFSHWFSW